MTFFPILRDLDSRVIKEHLCVSKEGPRCCERTLMGSSSECTCGFNSLMNIPRSRVAGSQKHFSISFSLLLVALKFCKYDNGPSHTVLNSPVLYVFIILFRLTLV